ncbi:MAG: MATE family efflux transporter [Actinobacteria bacterium]|nr:MATE family efflux transporter [Thermoleophilia bacterium]MCB9011328.1 MATE family efflux transporter [Actinomycetota bacterium]
MADADRRILHLALPALGALAAEPLYVLADAAIVGHIGTVELAGLAVAGGLLSSAFWLLNFLSYATTARVARLCGWGRRDLADALGGQALWLAVILGVAVGVALVAAGPWLIRAMGGNGAVGDAAWTYMWISALGAPAVLVALSGQGVLRGVQDMRRPLLILTAANAVNIGLEMLLVFGLGMGIAGSALSTVIAQWGAAVPFLPSMLPGLGRPRRDGMRELLHLGGHLMVRTGALLGAFLLATALLARVGSASVAAHEIAFRCFILLALVLDAIAIAAQTLVGTSLGAGDVADARDLSRRMVRWGIVAGAVAMAVLALLHARIPLAFTDDPRVLDEAARMWWVFVLMQPMNAVVFVLDGVLIGAGDTEALMWGMLGSVALGAAVMAIGVGAGLGIVGVWWGLAALLVARCATNVGRFRGSSWAIVGAGGVGGNRVRP